MEITLKNIKYSDFASHETACFEATVYKDGKRWCKAHNDGQGGCTFFDSIGKQNGSELYAEIKEYDDAAPSKTITDVGPEPWEMKITLEIVVDRLLGEHLTLKDMKRALKKKVVGKEGSKLVEWKGKPTPDRIKQIKNHFPEITILNDLPEVEALELWKAA